MRNMQTGNEIVGALAGDRPWWRLRAGDVDPWVKTLHPSATQELASRTEWIGEPWDGISDVALGDVNVAATKAKLLLSELRRAIRSLRLDDVRLPEARDVRVCIGSDAGRHTLVFDVDMEEFVLPLGLNGWALHREKGLSCRILAEKMAAHVGMADRKRPQLAARERRLRRAVEETAAGVGEGVAPLWLRMNWIPFHEDPKHVAGYEYVMLLVTLNDCLRWSPVGTERIWSVKDVRDHRSWYGKEQRRRAAALAGLAAAGSEGSISEVALALIEEHGLDPVATFRQAVEARLADRRGAIKLQRNDRSEQLHYVDGSLQATIGFKGGHYTPGSLTLWGDWPEQIAIGAKDRPLAAYVDHPAFVSTGIRVSKGSARQGALDLNHRIRLVAVESAVRAGATPVAMAA